MEHNGYMNQGPFRPSSSSSSTDSESDLEDLHILLAARRRRPSGSTTSLSGRYKLKSFRGNQIVLECFSSDARCKEVTRMNGSCLSELVSLFAQSYGASFSGYSISLEEQVIMSLNYLAHAGSMGRVASMFDHSKHTVSRVFNNILALLCRLFVDEVRPVDQNVIHPKIQNHPIRSVFQGCIGAIDGTHIGISPPARQSNVYRGRAGEPTTNVLAICDHDLLFTYVLVGAEGSMHDADLLRRAMSSPHLNFPFPQPGKYYLVDSGYSNREGFMSPYPRTRYHPHEFEEYGPENEREFFNQQHSSLRSVIERAFGVWKNKWRMVQFWGTLRGFDMDKWPAVIEAIAALHNFVRRRMREDHIDSNDLPSVSTEAPSIDLNRTPPMEDVGEAEMSHERDEIAALLYARR